MKQKMISEDVLRVFQDVLVDRAVKYSPGFIAEDIPDRVVSFIFYEGGPQSYFLDGKHYLGTINLKIL